MNAAWIAVGILLAAGAVTLLLARSRHGDVGCRWLAATAALWGIAFAAQGASAASVIPTGIELTPSDLVALLGLPVLVVGMLRLGPAGALSGPARGMGGGVVGRVIDGMMLALGVFAIFWVAALRSAYSATDIGPGSFIVSLVHPVADLAVLGGTLWLAVRAGSRGAAPYLALAAATVGDLLAVQARAGGLHPGSFSQLAWLLAICLLGMGGVPSAAESARLAAPGLRTGHEPPLGTVLAILAAAIAGLVTWIYVLANWGHPGPVPVLVGAMLTLALAARTAGLLRHAAAAAVLAGQSADQFLRLADRTSDAVLLCDATGLVRYASQAVANYGYEPAQLAGRSLPDLVHPDDLPQLLRTASAVVAGGTAQAGSLACRVRASDGTWRHVEAALSQHSAAGQEDLLLVTARDVSDQVALRRQVTHLTFHDGLTGLPNRSYLEERAKDLLARKQGNDAHGQTGAIIVDLDGFTAVNDSMGHGAGDVLLAQVGRRLRGFVSAHDTVARWGGDEFAVLVESAAGPQEIADIAGQLAGAVAAEPFSVAGRDISVTASVGVACADGGPPGPAAGSAELATDKAVPEHLLRNADLAMSRAKDSGGARVEVFAAHMYADVTRRMRLATELRTAIAEGDLRLEYQPVVELASSRVTDVEALVRWPRTGEPVDTAEVLSVAGESGLIVPLGDWILREACDQVASWRAAGWQIGLCVNFVSFRPVDSAGVAESALSALADADFPASALTLEVSERVLIHSGPAVIEGLSRLRDRGARLAIDDFGTGYASLAYLRELPVDIIKIAPSYLAGLGTDAILAMLTGTIVQVGHDLGIEVVAKGIERPEQLELLRAMGCRLGQGNLVGPPRSADSIEPPATADGVKTRQGNGAAGTVAPGRARTRQAASGEVAPGDTPADGQAAARARLSVAHSFVKSVTRCPDTLLSPSPRRPEGLCLHPWSS